MWASRLRWSAVLAWHLNGQARFPFLPLERIHREQRRRVQRMALHAYRSVPYYRETMDRLGLRPSDFNVADDLQKLPVLERAQLQRDPEYFLSTAQPRARYLELSSGATSGEPLTVYHDLGSVIQNAAHGERERSIYTRLIGRRFGYREATFGAVFGARGRVQRFSQDGAWLPAPLRIQRTYVPVHDPPEQTAELLNTLRPHVVHATGSVLDLLFAYLGESGVPIWRPRLIRYDSDALADETRALIAERYGIPVFAAYTATEAFKIGFECERHSGLHLNLDLYPLRLVGPNGEPRAVGEAGEVVVSNLVNRATVVLNYRLGDVVRLLPGACPCGRSLPLLSIPEARSGDVIELASGRLLHPYALLGVFLAEGRLWQHQVVQHSHDRFSVNLVVGDGCDRDAMRERVVTGLRHVLGDDAQIDVVFVGAVERTASGKLLPVISLLRRAPQPAAASA